MNLLHYFVQVNLYLVLFYGFYRLLLFGETFYALNRAYLLGSAVLSFGIPFWYSDYVQSFFITQQVNEAFYSVLSPAIFGVRASVKNPFTWYDLLRIFYVICTAFLAIKLMFNLLQLKKLLNNPATHAEQGVGFSFFNFVFVDKDLQKREVVLAHEYVHIKQLHSADVMLFELIAVLCWFNPVVYFYKKSIKNIHEFIADDIASRLEPTKADYAMLLFSRQFGLNPHQLTNTFFHHSTLKRRIEMLQKPRSRKTALLKYGFTAPLFALMLVIASASIAKQETIKKVEILCEIAAKTPISELVLIPSEEFIGANNAIISGKVTATEDGKSLAGVTVTVVGKNRGTTTDLNGEYRINASSEDELTFSFEGFEVNTTPVTDKTVINVSLKGYTITTTALSEVVVAALKNREPLNEEDVFTSVEENPEFSGGVKEMYKFIAQNLRYPAAAQRANVQGKVFVKFIVRKDGFASDFSILKGIGFGCDEETVRVLSLLPQWKPGKQKGKPVNVYFTMPVSFILEDDNDENKYLLSIEKLTVVENGEIKTFTDKDEIKREQKRIMEKLQDKGLRNFDTKKLDIKYNELDKSATYTVYDKISKSNDGNKDKVYFKMEGSEQVYPSKSLKLMNTDNVLWVIDGVIKDGIPQLKPDEIESMSVLKDASATAIYGEKGKNGVIIVTTRKNFITKEEPKFTITGKQLFTLKVGKNREIIDATTANEYPSDRIMQVNIIKLNDIKARKTSLNEYEQKVLNDGYDGWVDIWVKEQ